MNKGHKYVGINMIHAKIPNKDNDLNIQELTYNVYNTNKKLIEKQIEANTKHSTKLKTLKDKKYISHTTKTLKKYPSRI